MKRLFLFLIYTIFLSVLIVVTYLLNSYIKYEESYDTNFSNVNEIYRLKQKDLRNNIVESDHLYCSRSIGPFLKQSFPNVINYVRLWPIGMPIITTDNESFFEDVVYGIDSSFFNVFNVELIKGSFSEKHSNSIFISEFISKKCFKDENPIGKTLKLSFVHGTAEFIVQAVFKDINKNSHFKFNILFSHFEDYEYDPYTLRGWDDENYYTYILLKHGTDPSLIRDSISLKLHKYIGGHLQQENLQFKFQFQPLSKIHLYYDDVATIYNTRPKENIRHISIKVKKWILSVLLSLLLFSYILYISNYQYCPNINNFKRKNIAICQIFKILLPVLLSLLMLYVFSNWFFYLIGIDIDHIYNLKKEFLKFYLIILISFFTIGAFLIYIKEKIKFRRINFLKYAYFVFILIVSIVSISACNIFYLQYQYINNKDLMFNHDDILIFHQPFLSFSKIDTFKYELLKDQNIMDITCGWIPGGGYISKVTVQRLDSMYQKTTTLNWMATESNYFSFFNIDLIAGKEFDEERTNNKGKVIINIAALKELGFESADEAIGSSITCRGKREIIGVINDYHQANLYQKIEPLAITYMKNAFDFIAIKYKDINDLPALTKKIEGKWNMFFSNNPIKYFSLNDYLETNYKELNSAMKFAFFITTLCFLLAFVSFFAIVKFDPNTVKIKNNKFDKLIYLIKRYINLFLVSLILAILLSYSLHIVLLNSFAFKMNILVLAVIIPVIFFLFVLFLFSILFKKS